MGKNIYALTDYETTGVDPEKDLPIEVGILFLDHNFSIIDKYECLMKWPSLTEPGTDQSGWKSEYLDAYRVHKISHTQLMNQGRSPTEAIILIDDICNHFSPTKPIIMSDNPWFEMSFTRKLFKGRPFPFHFNAWSVNILHEVTKIYRGDVPHRAMSDVMLMYKNLIRSLEKVGFFKEV